MRTSTASRALAVARTGVAVAAFALASCAADDLGSTQESVSAAPAPSCAGHAPTQTLFLEDTDGNPFTLVHFSGCGWKYIGRETSGEESRSALGKLSFSPGAASQAATPAAHDDEPLAVFVDGPTGYTFAWIQDAGWKFIGQVTDGNR